MDITVELIPNTSSFLMIYFPIIIGTGLLILGIYIGYLIIRALKIYIEKNTER